MQAGTVPFEAIVEVHSNSGVLDEVSEKVTVPVGKVNPESDTEGVTTAVKLTAWLTADGAGVSGDIATVVLVPVTFCIAVAGVPAVKFESPLTYVAVTV